MTELKKKIENPDYKQNILKKQNLYIVKYRLWQKAIKELCAISIFDE